MKTTITAILILLASTAMANPPIKRHVFKHEGANQEESVFEFCIRGQVWYGAFNHLVQVLDEEGLPESCGFEDTTEPVKCEE